MASPFKLTFQLQFNFGNLKPKSMDLGLLVRLVNIVKLTNSTDDDTNEAFEEQNFNSSDHDGSKDLYQADHHLDCTRVYQFIFSVFQCCYNGESNHDKDN